MDARKLRDKLVGSEDERAVSPVIGVILMVAITVILAAVIAAFVLDVGDSVDQDAQAGVTIDIDESNESADFQVTSLGNSDFVNVSAAGEERGELGVGDSASIDVSNDNGTAVAIAVIEADDIETVVASEDYNFA